MYELLNKTNNQVTRNEFVIFRKMKKYEKCFRVLLHILIIECQLLIGHNWFTISQNIFQETKLWNRFIDKLYLPIKNIVGAIDRFPQKVLVFQISPKDIPGIYHPLMACIIREMINDICHTATSIWEPGSH